MAYIQKAMRYRSSALSSQLRAQTAFKNPSISSRETLSSLSTLSTTRSRLTLSVLSQSTVSTSPFHRSFRTIPLIRYAEHAIPTVPNPQQPPIPPTTPPVASPNVKRNRFAFLRWIPWKTIIVLGGGLYLLALIDEALAGGVEAALDQFTVPDNTWIYLNLNDLHVTESPHSERALQLLPFVSSAGKRRMTVFEMTVSLATAAADPRVKGLVLAFNDSMIDHRAILTGEVIESHLGMGVMTELQKAIGNFRIQKRAQRMAEKGENEVVEPPYLQINTEATQGFVKFGENLPDYHPSQDVVIAVSDKYSNGFDYALAAAASRIFMQPTGQVELTGMSIQQLFFGNVLKKYGVDFKVEARREYKSALAAVSESGWNQPTRDNLEDLMWSLQSSTLQDLQMRKIPLDRRLPTHLLSAFYEKNQDPEIVLDPESLAIHSVEQFIREDQRESVNLLKPLMDVLQQGPWSSQEALKMGVIDGIGYHHDLLEELQRVGIKTWSLRKYADTAYVQAVLGRYDLSTWVLPQLLEKKDKKDKKSKEKQAEGKNAGIRLNLALIHTREPPTLEAAALKFDIFIPRNVGLIYLDSAIEGKGKFGGEAIAAYILKAARDKNIHSIVLRINSPGGDAIASDTIWRAVTIARQSKPVIASFGDVAASGGYYIAAGADSIFTNNTTITGSIGVIAGWPVIRRLLDMVEVTSDSIQSLPNAAWRHMELGLPESEMRKLSAHIDETYETFKTVVSQGRNMSMENVEEFARGQVFTGAQALRLGLADKLGGLEEALNWAGLVSLERSNMQDPMSIREQMDEEWGALVDSALHGGEMIQKMVKDAVNASPMYGDQPEPESEKFAELMKRLTIQIHPQVNPVVIPHINYANEAFGVALATAFQSDDERSPVPIDQPTEVASTNGSLIVGALFGIAQSNNIPLWQFPAFCYWYMSQAAGNMGSKSTMGGFLQNWFGRLLNEGGMQKDTGRPTRVFAGGETAWDVRMELPPLEILS